MAKEKGSEEFIHESLQDPGSIVQYFEAIAQGFSSGRLLFCSNKDELVLKPRGMLDFSIKARRKSDTVKLSIKVAWSEGKDAPPEPGPLTIRPRDEPDEAGEEG
mgnify:FL=1